MKERIINRISKLIPVREDHWREFKTYCARRGLSVKQGIDLIFESAGKFLKEKKK